MSECPECPRCLAGPRNRGRARGTRPVKHGHTGQSGQSGHSGQPGQTKMIAIDKTFYHVLLAFQDEGGCL